MNNALILAFLQFVVCVAVIGYAGTKLTRYGDAIADRTGFGGTWIGVILLASITSLPELVTGVSSVTVAGVPDIAVGDVLGSCVFNLMIIVILDFLHRGESVYRRASQGHILSAGFGVMLIGFAGFSIVVSGNDHAGAASHALGHVGLYSPLFLLFYAVSMRTVFRYEREHVSAFTEELPDRYPDLTLRQAVLRYMGAAALVVAAGIWLPFVAGDIADLMQWHQSFVGTLFVAFATSVPEMVVTVAALRIGSLDMAIGNLFGSNLFNIAILAVDDLLFLEGPLFAGVSSSHAISAFSAVIMTGVAIVGLLYRPRGRVLRTVGWASIFLFAIYIFNSYLLYILGGQ